MSPAYLSFRADNVQAMITVQAKYGVVEKTEITPLTTGFTRLEAANMEDSLQGLKIHEIDDFCTIWRDLGLSPHIRLVACWLNSMLGKGNP